MYKFRFWDKEEKKMIEWEEALASDFSLYALQQGNGKYEKPMPFTGMKDLKQKEMYVGDIVECFTSGYSVVVMKQGTFGLQTKDHEFTPFYDIYGHCEILGDIYRSPELLQENQLSEK